SLATAIRSSPARSLTGPTAEASVPVASWTAEHFRYEPLRTNSTMTSPSSVSGDSLIPSADEMIRSWRSCDDVVPLAVGPWRALLLILVGAGLLGAAPRPAGESHTDTSFETILA